jgi:hypothetical protein
VSGSTLNATRDFPLSFTCGGVPMERAGVWYTIQGTGNSLSASTCSAILNFASRLTLFEGASCDELKCIDTANSNDQGTCQEPSMDGLSSTINWKSEVDKIYYIYVHGGLGFFELSVSDLLQSTENNFCPQALSLTPGQQISGNTSEASIGHFNGDFCGSTIDNAGVWYSIEGAGESIQITGCSSGDDYHFSVSVFEGSCSNLTCVTGETFPTTCYGFGPEGTPNRRLQPVDPLQSLNWFAETGVSYKIYVHGQSPSFSFEGGTGSFELITNSLPATNLSSSAPSESLGAAPLEPISSTELPTNPPTNENTTEPRSPAPTVEVSPLLATSNSDMSDSTASSLPYNPTTITLMSIVGLLLFL